VFGYDRSVATGDGGLDEALDEAWMLMSALVFAERQRLGQAAADIGLTPMQAHALVLLDPDRPPPVMGELAQQLACEPSNLTHLVNALERVGYVRRRPDPGNHRAKVVELTGTGRAARSTALTPLRRAPAVLRALDPEDAAALRDILRRLHAGPPGHC
jgi:DNA-binding MarR family transcriptional regulator